MLTQRPLSVRSISVSCLQFLDCVGLNIIQVVCFLSTFGENYMGRLKDSVRIQSTTRKHAACFVSRDASLVETKAKDELGTSEHIRIFLFWLKHVHEFVHYGLSPQSALY